jgi:hypothetical protein
MNFNVYFLFPFRSSLKDENFLISTNVLKAKRTDKGMYMLEEL